MKKILFTTTILVFLAGLLPVQGMTQMLDFGDAPEGVIAYPYLSVMGSFPTCMYVGTASWIQHTNFGAWFGPTFDLEPDGNGGLCPSFGPYDNDECFMDGEAGLLFPQAYTIDPTPAVVPCPIGQEPPSLGVTCTTAVWGVNVDIDVTNMMPSSTPGYVNVIIDWNQDGFWGGSSSCPPTGTPAPEHVLQNFFSVPNSFSGPLSVLGPPPFLIGSNPGYVWARFTITEQPVPLPWDGSGMFEDGESEDYLLLIDPDEVPTAFPELQTECPVIETECPVVVTSCLQTGCPVIETECPAILTECPTLPTWCPVNPTFCPKEYTECPSEEFTIWPEAPTWCPVIFTVCPNGPTLCPDEPTSCPMDPTWCPEMPTHCPLEPLLTTCPENPTACPDAHTECPIIPTLCPPMPVSCPVGDTFTPIIPTECPEVETQCPVITTVCSIEDCENDGFKDYEDNCPNHPNGPSGGICTKGTIGEPCMNNGACGIGGFCSMNQEDTYPPQENTIGDACDCESDFTCDGDVDADDVTAFLADFGREQFYLPCTNQDPCNGDFDCDVDVDADDVTIFLADFGREEYYNPCPACVGGNWCVYP